jgi:hypothetical protein
MLHDIPARDRRRGGRSLALVLTACATVLASLVSAAPAGAAAGDVATVMTVYAGRGGLGQDPGPIYPYRAFCVRAEVRTVDGTLLPGGGSNTYFIGAGQYLDPQPLSGDGSTTYCLGSSGGGTLPIRVEFSGSPGYLPSSGNASVSVVPRPVTMDPVSVDPDEPVYGQAVHISTSLDADTGTDFSTAPPTLGAAGQVTLRLNGTSVDTVHPTGSDNVASFTRTDLPAGTSTIALDYSGGGIYGTASRSTSVTVAKAVTAISVSATPDPSSYGTEVTYRANVVSPTATVDQGQVQFAVDGSDVGEPVTVGPDGTASLPQQTRPAGSASLTATYLPSSNFTGSQATPVTVTVGTSPTSVTLGSSVNPAQFGAPVTLTATVGSPVETPTGEVTFTVDGKSGDPVSVVDGVATLETTTLAAGSHTVTAEYLGNDNLAGSTSAVLTQTVSKATTTTTLASDANPTPYGTSPTFTATVASSTTDVTGGTVEFRVDGDLEDTAPVDDDGIATFTPGKAPAGSYEVTATYVGTDDLATSTSAALTQVIGKATTTTTLTSDANPVAYGTSPTLTATVASSTTDVTGGSVEFHVDGDLEGTSPVDDKGIATFTLSDVTSGSHHIVATFLGTDDLEASTSTDLTQVVDPAPAAPSSKAAPRITGAKSEGHTLTAHSRWSTPVTYQWRADGVKIKGATRAKLTLGRHEAGRRITVAVSSKGRTATSAPTKIISSRKSRLVLSTYTVKHRAAFRVTATGLHGGQRVTVWLGGRKAYVGRADSRGILDRSVRFSRSIDPGTRRVRVSGYSEDRQRTSTIWTTVRYR